MIEKFKNWFHENSITEVECLVPDLGGIARGKTVSYTHLRAHET